MWFLIITSLIYGGCVYIMIRENLIQEGAVTIADLIWISLLCLFWPMYWICYFNELRDNKTCQRVKICISNAIDDSFGRLWYWLNSYQVIRSKDE